MSDDNPQQGFETFLTEAQTHHNEDPRLSSKLVPDSPTLGRLDVLTAQGAHLEVGQDLTSRHIQAVARLQNSDPERPFDPETGLVGALTAYFEAEGVYNPDRLAQELVGRPRMALESLPPAAFDWLQKQMGVENPTFNYCFLNNANPFRETMTPEMGRV